MGVGFVFSTAFFIARPGQCPVSAQAVAIGQVSSLKMVVQLLILPAAFGRFFPRRHMVQEEDLHSRVDVRERPAAPDRGAEPGIHRR
jgi:hypothetical protein